MVASVAGVSREIPLEFDTLRREADDTMIQDRLLAMLSAFSGIVALLLAMIGLYGTISYRVTTRRAEYGIRIALGAEAGSILRLLICDVATLVIAGESAGIGISLIAETALRKLLFAIGPRDPAAIAASAAFLALAALAAGYLPPSTRNKGRSHGGPEIRVKLCAFGDCEQNCRKDMIPTTGLWRNAVFRIYCGR